jgi:hypothetical protein
LLIAILITTPSGPIGLADGHSVSNSFLLASHKLDGGSRFWPESRSPPIPRELVTKIGSYHGRRVRFHSESGDLCLRLFQNCTRKSGSMRDNAYKNRGILQEDRTEEDQMART